MISTLFSLVSVCYRSQISKKKIKKVVLFVYNTYLTHIIEKCHLSISNIYFVPENSYFLKFSFFCLPPISHFIHLTLQTIDLEDRRMARSLLQFKYLTPPHRHAQVILYSPLFMLPLPCLTYLLTCAALVISCLFPQFQSHLAQIPPSP